jgi:periplasmic divalent cation tolerance protein|tara:strand:+ start:3231 stop:3548 length:318 start_codon:yes stop_codon:yes gene_type:complete
METDHIVILTTCPTMEEAVKIETDLLQRRLAACVQKDKIESSYLWKGNLQTATEVRLMIKTKQALFAAVEGAIRSGSSYDTPEVIALPMVAGSSDYLSWIDQVTA